MHASLEAVGFVPVLALGYALVARAEPPGRFRVASAVGALALVFAAFATELQPLALHTFLWAHLLQNVVLAEWAPALLVLALPPALAARISDPHFFAGLLAQPFVTGIRVALLACVAMCIIAGATSALRGSERPRRAAVHPPIGDIAVVSEPQ